MRKHNLAASIAAAALIPGLAMAEPSCEQQRHDHVTGTVAGAGIGAVLGGLIGGRHDRVAGAAVGGVGGAIAGNQLSKPDADCAHAYGFYDGKGAWHANAVDRQAARGYYARDGAWVDGAPNGYYDSRGAWTVADASATRGFYNDSGRWVPTSVQGYYDADGRWTAPSAETGRANAAYRRREGQRGNLESRENVIDQMIEAGAGDGRLSRWQASSDTRTMSSIRRQESRMARSEAGQLSYRDEATIQARLDGLSDNLRAQERSSGRRSY